MDTLQETVLVMGRRTFQCLPKKLEGRVHVVLSSRDVPGADAVFSSLDAFLTAVPTQFPAHRVFVIGGADLLKCVYEQYGPLIDVIWHSEIKGFHPVDSEDVVYFDTHTLQDMHRHPTVSRDTTNVIFHKITPVKHEEYQYLDLMKRCMEAECRQTRNGLTRSTFHGDLTFDLTRGFPLLTTKKVFLRGIFEELLFFLKGQTDSKLLEAKQVHIWKPNTTPEFLTSCGLPYEEGDMGPMYGWNWKHFGAAYKGCKEDYTGQGYNQIEYVLNLLEKDPTSRRILMTTYNPAQAKEGVLYPCHSIVVQFFVEPQADTYFVSMTMYQRSVDVACGLPFNIASNALLLHLVCETLQARTGKTYTPNKLHLMLGDIHVYEAHREGVLEQLGRIPKFFPTMRIRQQRKEMEEYVFDDVEVIGYSSHPSIKYEMVA